MFIRNIKKINRQARLKQILIPWSQAYVYGLLSFYYFKLHSNKLAEDMYYLGGIGCRLKSIENNYCANGIR